MMQWPGDMCCLRQMKSIDMGETEIVVVVAFTETIVILMIGITEEIEDQDIEVRNLGVSKTQNCQSGLNDNGKCEKFFTSLWGIKRYNIFPCPRAKSFPNKFRTSAN